MRLAVISDLHANGDALRAVDAKLSRLSPDAVVCLGDVVGYNAEPQACVDFARSRCDVTMLGNHDAVATAVSAGDGFQGAALEGALWSRSHLTADALHWLSLRPVRERFDDGRILLVHGSVGRIDRYVRNVEEADAEWGELKRLSGKLPRVVLLGHTHHSAACVRTASGVMSWVDHPRRVTLSAGESAFLNPGAVGQPRDRDPRASFLMLDTGSWTAEWFRIDYDVCAAASKVMAAGLPKTFADRLLAGT